MIDNLFLTKTKIFKIIFRISGVLLSFSIFYLFTKLNNTNKEYGIVLYIISSLNMCSLFGLLGHESQLIKNYSKKIPLSFLLSSLLFAILWVLYAQMLGFISSILDQFLLVGVSFLFNMNKISSLQLIGFNKDMISTLKEYMLVYTCIATFPLYENLTILLLLMNGGLFIFNFKFLFHNLELRRFWFLDGESKILILVMLLSLFSTQIPIQVSAKLLTIDDLTLLLLAIKFTSIIRVYMNTANAYIYPILSEVKNLPLIRNINLINFCVGLLLLLILGIVTNYNFLNIQNPEFFFRVILIIGLAQMVFISFSSKPTFFILHNLSKIVLKCQLLAFTIALLSSLVFLILRQPFNGVLIFMFISISLPHIIISFFKYES